MSSVQRWCRVSVVTADGYRLIESTLEGPGAPDLGAVDGVARLALLARHIDGHLVLSDVSTSMGELLELAGLRLEVDRRTEPGEQSPGTREVGGQAHPGHPSP